jgi:hypothetical protein
MSDNRAFQPPEARQTNNLTVALMLLLRSKAIARRRRARAGRGNFPKKLEAADCPSPF